MMKRTLLALLALALAPLARAAQKPLTVSSPDGQVTVTVTLADRIYYSVLSHGQTLVDKGHIALEAGGSVLGRNPVLKGKKETGVSRELTPLFPLKQSRVMDKHNQLTMTMKGGYAVQWRVWDDGVAYRFITSLPGDVEVRSEDCTIALPSACDLLLQQPSGFKTSCEELYTTVKSNEWKSGDRMSELPLVITCGAQRVLFTEYDLHDYPGMFMRGTGDNVLSADHPKVPLDFGDDGDRSVKIAREADYIARTKGTRQFPWRSFTITRDDRDMACNTMPTRLAGESQLKETGWIRPGKTTWEWWNGSIPYGPDVNFRSGLNLDTYKYFVDFAAKNGLEYILMDEGWAKSTRDPYTPNPDVDLHELVRYASSRNVGIILWLTWLTVERNPDLFATFEKWGISGVKIDFMDRQDQWMVNFYERTARMAAQHHLFVDFHGAYHPSGMQDRYPNVLSFEGVRGMEYMDECKPDNSVYYPFVRNAVGPMDYTPGAMLCAQPECFSSRRPNSASKGTRAYQMGLYVVFESHIQMLSDNPTLYNMYPDCRDFMAGCPVSWDETRVLAAGFGQYVLVARRSGDKWYIGGMTNGSPRDIEAALSFLSEGKTYRMTSFTDGINADAQAMDYRRAEKTVGSKDKLSVHMARNGGFAAVLEP